MGYYYHNNQKRSKAKGTGYSNSYNSSNNGNNTEADAAKSQTGDQPKREFSFERTASPAPNTAGAVAAHTSSSGTLTVKRSASVKASSAGSGSGSNKRTINQASGTVTVSVSPKVPLSGTIKKKLTATPTGITVSLSGKKKRTSLVDQYHAAGLGGNETGGSDYEQQHNGHNHISNNDNKRGWYKQNRNREALQSLQSKSSHESVQHPQQKQKQQPRQQRQHSHTLDLSNAAADSLSAALNGSNYNPRPQSSMPSQQQQSQQQQYATFGSSSNEESQLSIKGQSMRPAILMVSNLDPEVSDRDLHIVFSRFGEVRAVQQHFNSQGWPNGNAEIMYNSAMDAQAALVGTNEMLADGRRLTAQLRMVSQAPQQIMDIASTTSSTFSSQQTAPQSQSLTAGPVTGSLSTHSASEGEQSLNQTQKHQKQQQHQKNWKRKWHPNQQHQQQKRDRDPYFG